MTETLAIAGYGYCGRATAASWRSKGGRVVALDRFRHGVPDGLTAVVATLGGPTPPPAIPADLGLVTVGTVTDGADTAGAAADWLASCGVRRAVYLSSTSVYGTADGERVTGATPPLPDTPMGLRRVAAEASFFAACAIRGVEGMVLRLPGIYGPHRTNRQRLEAGTYAYPDGYDRWTNRIHVEDIASAVEVLLERGEAGHAYLASDGHPFHASELIEWSCETLGLPLPAPVPWSELSERAREFWSGSRRCDPAELRALGWAARYPTYREGHLAAWAVEDGEA